MIPHRPTNNPDKLGLLRTKFKCNRKGVGHTAYAALSSANIVGGYVIIPKGARDTTW